VAAWDKEGRRLPYTLFECAAFGFAIKAICRNCGHSNSFGPAGLWWLFKRKHWSDNLSDAAKRFRCVRCGDNRALLAAVRVPATIPDRYPDPPQAEWKRACSRYRS